MNEQKQFVAVQPIDRYEGPQWLVKPWEPAPYEGEEIEDIKSIGYEVIEPKILGWGEYNAIIRVTLGDGPFDQCDYLATLR